MEITKTDQYTTISTNITTISGKVKRTQQIETDQFPSHFHSSLWLKECFLGIQDSSGHCFSHCLIWKFSSKQCWIKPYVYNGLNHIANVAPYWDKWSTRRKTIPFSTANHEQRSTQLIQTNKNLGPVLWTPPNSSVVVFVWKKQ